MNNMQFDDDVHYSSQCIKLKGGARRQRPVTTSARAWLHRVTRKVSKRGRSRYVVIGGEEKETYEDALCTGWVDIE